MLLKEEGTSAPHTYETMKKIKITALDTKNTVDLPLAIVYRPPPDMIQQAKVNYVTCVNTTEEQDLTEIEENEHLERCVAFLTSSWFEDDVHESDWETDSNASIEISAPTIDTEHSTVQEPLSCPLVHHANTQDDKKSGDVAEISEVKNASKENCHSLAENESSTQKDEKNLFLRHMYQSMTNADKAHEKAFASYASWESRHPLAENISM